MRFRRSLLVGLAVLLGVGGCSKKKEQEPAASRDTPEVRPPREFRALWVWENEAVIDAAARPQLLDLCRGQGISTLYLYTGDFPDNQYNPDYTAGLSDLVRTVHREGLTVCALYGRLEPRLLLRDNQYETITLVRDFLIFNQKQPANQRFDALLVDADPRSLPGWDRNEANVQEGFLELIMELRKAVLEFDTNLPLGLALPVSCLQQDGLPGVLDQLQYVVLKDGTEDSAAALRNAEPGLRRAAEKGIKAMLGRDVTGMAESPETLNAALQNMTADGVAHSAFGGVAIHDYAALRGVLGLTAEAATPAEPPAVP